MKFLLIVFAIALVIVLLINANKSKDKDDPNKEPTEPIKPHKQRTQKVKPYRKLEKKMQQKAGKQAMEEAEYIHLTIEEANNLFLHNSSADEMKLLDIILDAKLDGVDTVKVDRCLYDRMIFERNLTKY